MVIQFHEERLIDLESKQNESIKVVFAILMIQNGSITIDNGGRRRVGATVLSRNVLFLETSEKNRMAYTCNVRRLRHLYTKTWSRLKIKKM